MKVVEAIINGLILGSAFVAALLLVIGLIY